MDLPSLFILALNVLSMRVQCFRRLVCGFPGNNLFLKMSLLRGGWNSRELFRVILSRMRGLNSIFRVRALNSIFVTIEALMLSLPQLVL